MPGKLLSTLVGVTLLCSAEQSVAADLANKEYQVVSTSISKTGIDANQLVNLFDTAVREGSREKLHSAVAALAAFAGRIDLTATAEEDGKATGDLLADQVAKNVVEWRELMQQLARQLHKLVLGDHALQRILAQLLAVSMTYDDEQAFAAVMKLVPADVTHPILAYNLACAGARQKDRAALLAYTKLALALGKSSAQFRADEDFAPYLNDKAFTALLDGNEAIEAVAKEALIIREALLQSVESGDWGQFEQQVKEAERRGLTLVPPGSYTLALDLARQSARQKEREAMLSYLKIALRFNFLFELKFTEPLRTDRAFAPYAKDKEFQALFAVAKTVEGASSPNERDRLLEGLASDPHERERFHSQELEAKKRSLRLTKLYEVMQLAVKGGDARIFSYLYQTVERQRPEKFPFSYPLLTEAVEQRRHDIAAFLLKDRTLRAEANEDDTFMSIAIRNDDAKMVQLLMDSGGDFDRHASDRLANRLGTKLFGLTSSQFEISEGFAIALTADAVEVVKLALQRTSGLHLLRRSEYIKTVQVHLDTGTLSRRMVVALFDAGLDFNDLRDSEKRSLLAMAIQRDEMELVDYLVEEKNAPLGKDMLEMQAAVERNDVQLLERLIRHQRKLDPRWEFANADYWNNLDVLSEHLSGERGKLLETLLIGDRFDVIKTFTTSVIAPNDKPAHDAMLAVSIAMNNPQAVRYFLELGADPNVRLRGAAAEQNVPAINMAANFCQHQMVALLLDHGADARSVDASGESVLQHLALCPKDSANSALMDRLAPKK